MRRGLALILLLVVLFIFVIGAVLLLPTLTKGGGIFGKAPTPTMVLEKVIVAKQTIPQGSLITDDMIEYISLPPDAVFDVMYTASEKDNLKDKVARYPLDAGVVITSSMVVSGSEFVAAGGPLWAQTIPAGMTAISVPVTRLAAVSFGVADGAHVNITACMLLVDVDTAYQTILPNHTTVLKGPVGETDEKAPIISVGQVTSSDPWYQGRVEVEPSFRLPWHIIPSEEQRPRLVCQIIQQDVLVLRLGDFKLQQTKTETQEPAGTKVPSKTTPTPEKVKTPDVVTLVVSPQDSVTLTYLIYSGAKLSLTLRNATDQSRVATEAATLQFILSSYNISVPVKLPYAGQPRTDDLVDPYMPNDTVVVPAD